MRVGLAGEERGTVRRGTARPKVPGAPTAAPDNASLRARKTTDFATRYGGE